ncbi:hypothetical protein MAGR_72960 [Mycolicibacterium agri]|uniref:Uncharacterized protein n=2 Tax=Mycolicibacterium agri TaxID=36811 RepID=A0A7I9WDP8_MYCAG|nr:hypothetical protein MAGR_72960 [Mycolicibacterium agri]
MGSLAEIAGSAQSQDPPNSGDPGDLVAQQRCAINLVRQMLGHFSPEALVHYASYNNESMTRHLQQVWAAGPGMDKPGTILLRPAEQRMQPQGGC